jgi:CRP-like cAMP-binding protein
MSAAEFGRRCFDSGGVRSPASQIKEPHSNMIDRLRHDIQQRLEQLLAEADKLRHALLALNPRQRPAPARTARGAPRPAQPRTGSAQTAKPRTRTAPGVTATASPRTRTAPGATKSAVLGALADDRAMTAAEVATATGLARATVSTTLSRLAKNGEVLKADRGYRRPEADNDAAHNPADATPAR